MQKLLFKKITIRLILVAIISILIFSLILFQQFKYDTINQCDELLNQVSSSYENSQKSLEEKIELYKNDYLNRTYAIDFILKNNEDMRTNEGLHKINTLMQVDAIYVVDSSGKVILSTQDDLIGVNLLDYKECINFWPLIINNDNTESVVDLESDTIIEATKKDFFGVKSSIDEYSMIQIGINEANRISTIENTSISTILKETPTVYSTTIFAIDKKTGEILGLTTNNEQTLNFSLDNNDIISTIKSSTNGGIVKINNEYKFLKSKILDDFILVSYIDSSEIFSQIISQLFSSISIVSIIIILLYFTIRNYFKKYIINDFNNIDKNIKKIVSGDLNVTFKASNKDNKYLMDSLNNWKDSYKNKNFRMNKIINGINNNSAIFECLYSVNKNFFSENLKTLLNIDDTTWDIIQLNPYKLEEYIDTLKKEEDSEGVIFINNKYIIINSYTMENSFFGTILDKTDEITNNKNLLNKLEEAKINADKDSLTGLLNRNAFEREVKLFLEKDANSGIMILFDLDNFKQVNDNLGHPEGDFVLKVVAKTIQSCFRKDDTIARLGGDEFTVFINQNIPLYMLESKLDNLLFNIRKNLYDYYKKYNVSLSIGASYVDNTIVDYEDLYKCTDTALYIAKNLGKNRFYVNEDNIRCVRSNCIECSENCKKKKLLGL